MATRLQEIVTGPSVLVGHPGGREGQSEVRLMGLKTVEVLKELATSGLIRCALMNPGEAMVRTKALEQLWRNAGGKSLGGRSTLSPSEHTGQKAS